MVYKLSLLKRAELDLEEILAYKAQYYAGTADAFLTALEKTLNGISGNPLMYPAYDNNPRYRRAVVEDYLLFYRVEKEASVVQVYRILHGRRDLRKFLMK